MKFYLLTILLITTIAAQKVKHQRYGNDVTVNLKQYADENARIRKDLDHQIKRKKELVAEGNAHNANMKKVTGYVDAWTDDIKATQKAVTEFEANAKKTRVQWSDVKKTQQPYEPTPANNHKSTDAPAAPKKSGPSKKAPAAKPDRKSVV